MDTPRESAPAPWWARATLLALTLGAAWLRLPGLAAEEPWFDEVFSVVLASQDLPELLRRTIADQTNPPGFYLLLGAWTRLGGFDLAFMRALPALAGVLTVPALAMAARALGASWRTALAAAGLAAVSPLALAMSSELRAYTPLGLVTVLALIAAAREKPVALAVAGIALVSLHYFGALVVAALAVGALWAEPRRWRRAILPAIPAACALGAWMIVVIRSAGPRAVGGNASWIGAIGLRDIPSFASQIIGTFGTAWGTNAVTLAVAAALVAGLWASLPWALRQPTSLHAAASEEATLRRSARLLLCLALLPVLTVAATSLLLGRDLWVARYLIITLPAFWLLLARAADARDPRPRIAALTALLGWAALAGPLAERARPRKTAWSNVARALTAGAPRTVCANEPFVALPLRYQALSASLPLTVLDLDECATARSASAIILREETERSLDLLRDATAIVGPPRDLGTALPATRIRVLRWPVR